MKAQFEAKIKEVEATLAALIEANASPKEIKKAATIVSNWKNSSWDNDVEDAGGFIHSKNHKESIAMYKAGVTAVEAAKVLKRFTL